MTYTLILTMSLYFSGYKVGGTSSSIEHIPGFASEQQCLVAGNAWLKQVRESGSRGIHRAICVAQGSAQERLP